MANKNASCIIAKDKPGAILAGLLWHPIPGGDPVGQEQRVYAFSQSYESDLLVVAGNEVCLQIGFPQGKSFERDSRKSGALYALANLARMIFKNRDGILVWVTENPIDSDPVAVCLIENDLIVLDVMLSLKDATDLVEGYFKEHSQERAFGLVSNNSALFPDAEIIDVAYLFGRLDQPSLLRKPRRPRSGLAAKRTKKDLIKFLGFVTSVLAIVVGMNYFYQIKKAEMLKKIQKTETDKYFDEVKRRSASIGLGVEGVNAIRTRLETYPLMYDGWQLEDVKCDAIACTSKWLGQAAWSSKPLQVFGVIADKKEKTKQPTRAKNSMMQRMSFQSPHNIPLEGIDFSNGFIPPDSISDFCARGRLLMDLGSMKWTCDISGQPWPMKTKVNIEKGRVTEHKVTVQGSVALIGYVINQYRGQVFWKELNVQRSEEKRSNAGSDFMQFQLIGAVYASN